jgi:plasmid stability protein
MPASAGVEPYAGSEANMASLSVGKLGEETLARLRLRAARHGVSVDEEVRRILQDAVRAPERLGNLALRIFGPANGVDLERSELSPHDPPELAE